MIMIQIYNIDLWDYSDAYIVVSGAIIITGLPNDATEANKIANERNKEVIFKNCAPIIECTSEINNTQIDHAKDLNLVMRIYNLIEYNNYLETSGSL